MLSDADSRWPDGVIPYTVARDLARPERVREAMDTWQRAAGLRFVERGTERNYVTLRGAGSGCSSSVGMRGGQQFVNLGEECTVGNVVHELGHTIGLFHTQSRIDRDAYIRVRFDNLDKREWLQYTQHISDGDDVGGYDYDSIMHYSGSGFSRNMLPTIATVPPGIRIGQRDRLSPNDIRTVLKLYGKTPEEITINTNPPGLRLRIDGVLLPAPQRVRWAAGEKHTLAVEETIATGANSRVAFARWTNGGGREQTVTAGEEHVYTAHFAEQVRFRIAGAAAGGTVEVKPRTEDGFYPLGAQVRVKATPNAGFQFVRWTAGTGGVVWVTANGVGQSANPLLVPLTRDDIFYAARFTNAPVTRIE